MNLSILFASAIRIASLMYGGFVIFASMPLALLAAGMPSDAVPSHSPLVIIPLAACLIASGFIYVGVAGQRMAKSRWRRVFGGLLLAAPIAAGIGLLTPPSGPEWQPVALFFLVPASIVFICAIWPLHLTSELSEAPAGSDLEKMCDKDQ